MTEQSITPGTPPQEYDPQIRAETVGLLYRQLPSALLGTLISSLIMLIVLWPVTETRYLTAWFVLITVVSLARYVDARRYQASKPDAEAAERWMRHFLTGSSIAGAAWALGVTVLFPEDSVIHQVFLAFVVAGMSAGAVSSLSYSSQAFNSFLVLLVCPLAINLAWHNSPIGWASTGLLGMFLGLMILTGKRIRETTVENIAMRLRATQREHRMQEQEQTLRQQDERLQEAQQIAKLGYWHVDLVAGTTEWSSEIYHLLGLDPATTTADLQMYVGRILDEDRERVQQVMRDAIAHDRVGAVHYRVRRPNGELRHVFARGKAMRDAKGNPRTFVGTAQDVTEQKLVEAELIQAREQADRASRAKSDFLSRMSHELRTPLNAILGFAQLLKLDDKPPLTARQQNNVEEIIAGGTHLLALINEILDLSRIDSGKMDISMENILLADVIHETCSLLQPLANHRSIALNHETDSGIRVHADYTRLKQVLMNLASNAINYNRDNGHVTIRCLPNGRCVRIEVTDTGDGIPEADRERLFHPFERLEQGQRQTEGTGIGLVICKSLVELMGGRLGLDSTPGEGTTFWFELNTPEP